MTTPCSFTLVLHAHLPFVRHPEHPVFFEEEWLFEAITETYIPLIQAAERLRSDGITTAFNLSISATLATMLRDPLLQQRYRDRLVRQHRFATEQAEKAPSNVRPALAFHRDRFASVLETYDGLHRDVLAGFEAMQANGVELMTTAATHGFLPLLDPQSIQLQLQTGRRLYTDLFGHPPSGLWLPECGYHPQFEADIVENGYRYTILERHGLEHAVPQPRSGTWAPIITPGGLICFGRDHATARQVWSRDVGYPGDPVYREYHRDWSAQCSEHDLNPLQPAASQRSGCKVFRITGPGPDKAIYNPKMARHRASIHARHFIDLCRQIDDHPSKRPPTTPHRVAPYDAELFGHWWFEGPWFLESVFRIAATEPDVHAITLSAYLDRVTELDVCQAAISTWGDRGYNEVWLNPRNAHWLPQLRHAAATFVRVVGPKPLSSALEQRAAAQAARELQLAQASDWPFMLDRETSVQYATRRLRDHLGRLQWLLESLERGTIDESILDGIERLDPIFPNVEVDTAPPSRTPRFEQCTL